MNGNKKRNAINPDKLGLWETCEPGVFATAKGTCRICGGGCDAHQVRVSQVADNLVAKPKNPDRQPNPRPALVTADCSQAIVPNSNARYIIVLSRGHSGIPLDRDNLGSGFKNLRDAVAKHLLGSESDAERHGFQWEYRQFLGKGVKVEIYKREAVK